MYKEGIFTHTHKYSSNWYLHYTAGQCDPKKHYFYKGSTPSDWNRSRLSRAEIQVCVSTKLRSWPMGWAICDFLPFFCCRIFPLKCLFFRVRDTRGLGGPRTATFFWKTRSPNRPSGIYIYIDSLNPEQVPWMHRCAWLASTNAFLRSSPFD